MSIGVAGEAEGVRGTALTAAYRIAQEALRNVDQHAGAHHVRMEVSAGDGHLDLEIADDGIGFSDETRDLRVEAGHLGLTLIHDLARESGGDLEVRSAPRAGTTLRAHLPLGGGGAPPTGRGAGGPPPGADPPEPQSRPEPPPPPTASAGPATSPPASIVSA